MQSLACSSWMEITASAAAMVGLSLGVPASPQDLRAVRPDATPTIEDSRTSVPIVFQGLVLEPGGRPAAGAVVLSSAGGKAVTDQDGSFRFEARVPLELTSVRVTAIGGGGEKRMASAKVELLAVPGIASVETLVLAPPAGCEAGWLPTFGASSGLDGSVHALAVFDDGDGPALYAGGSFTSAGGLTLDHVAKWDGASWTALGSGTDASVWAFSVYDDGGGPELYAAGDFWTAGGVQAYFVARWNGSRWARLGGGTGGKVRALAVYDDGSGPALYVGGRFLNAAGVGQVNNIAKWNGSSWAPLGSGVAAAFSGPEVDALAVYDDGSGPALYAGGNFTTAGDLAASRIAKWNGSSWSALGSGMNSTVQALAVHDDGTGPALYAGGSFTAAGGVAAGRIARWNVSSWSALGSGVNNTVYALTVLDDGGGPDLFAGGVFSSAGGVSAWGIARWNGTGWSVPGDDGNGHQYAVAHVYALTAHDDGSGAELYAGGRFDHVRAVSAGNIARCESSLWWMPLGREVNSGVAELTVYDDGGGPALYAAGSFSSAGALPAHGIAKWDGSSWATLGSPGAFHGWGQVRALIGFDDGSGPALYAGTGAWGSYCVEKWDGSSWSGIGSGLDRGVLALAVFDDGSGPALYASFDLGLGGQGSSVRRWDGSSWSDLGSGFGGTSSDAVVWALAVFDDGSAPALYAGGHFDTAGGAPATNVAKWDGSSWSALGSGLYGDFQHSVLVLTVFDDGSGPALYAAGEFTTGGGAPANYIARWDGSSWVPLDSEVNGRVQALTAYSDANGPQLLAGGLFTSAGGVAANRIARWDGSSWAALGSGMDREVFALAVFDGSSGPALHAGGLFTALDSNDANLAMWGPLADTLPPTLTCPSNMLVGDRIGSPPGEIVTFSVTATDCRDPAPVVLCTPSSGSFFPPGTTVVTCAATDASGNVSTSRFRVTVARGVRPPP